MDLKEEKVEDEEGFKKAQFRKELDNWFQSKGIIADLRSHLRHLMVSALQNTRVGPKISEKTSPKIQAINLLVAEYLLKRGCHYTLSVFTSEVNFSHGFPFSHPSFLLGHSKNRCLAGQTSFQESEVEEIINALGLSSCVGHPKRVNRSYFDETNKDSLLEILLQCLSESSDKLNVLQGTIRDSSRRDKNLLSNQWACDVANVLSSEKMKPAQVASIQKSIRGITEAELRMLAGKELEKKTQVLLERERRIQDRLTKYQEDILVKLIEAEEEFTLRKNCIDEEMTQRQKLLSKMVVEWNAKHDKIIKLSNKFFNLRDENKILRKAMQELEEENKNIKMHGQKQNELIKELRNEREALIKKLEELAKSNAFLVARRDGSINMENSQLPARENDLHQVDGAIGDGAVVSPESEGKSATNTSSATRSTENEDESTSISPSFSNGVLSEICKTLSRLEGESSRINNKYLEYKRKQWGISDSEASASCSEDSIGTVNYGCQDSCRSLKVTKFSQTDEANPSEKKRCPLQGIKGKNETEQKKIGFLSENSDEEIWPNISVKTPTKRQLENREYFLKNRHILREMENTKAMETGSESSHPSSTFGSADLLPHNPLNIPKISAALNSVTNHDIKLPLNVASVDYGGIVLEMREKTSLESSKITEESVQPLELNDSNCLTLLEENRLKP